MTAMRARHTEAIRELVEWERDAALASVRYNGIPLWRLVRTDVVRRHLVTSGVRGRSTYNRPRVSRMAKLARGVVVSLAHWWRLAPRRVLFVGFARRRFDDGVWVDTFCDPLIDLLGADSAVCIERPFVGEHFRPARTKHLVDYDWVRVAAAFAARLFSPIAARRARAPIDALAPVIAAKFDLPVARVRRTLARALVRFRLERAVFNRVLARVRPRAVFFVNRWLNFPLINACRDAGVPVYELQHGALSVHSFQYQTEFDPALDPDGVVAFGEYWVDWEWGVPAETVLPIGFPYLSARATDERRGDRILLVSKPINWSDLARTFAAICERHPERDFILKLHPQEVDDWEQRYPFATRANVQVITDQRVDVYKLFEECSVAFGDDSTLLFEASFFGLRVGLLNLDGSNQSEALAYAPRFGFQEIATLDDADALLDMPPSRTEHHGNPFFAAFDEAAFRELVDR